MQLGQMLDDETRSRLADLALPEGEVMSDEDHDLTLELAVAFGVTARDKGE